MSPSEDLACTAVVRDRPLVKAPFGMSTAERPADKFPSSRGGDAKANGIRRDNFRGNSGLLAPRAT